MVNPEDVNTEPLSDWYCCGTTPFFFAHKLKIILHVDHLVSIQVGLELHMNECGGMINKDTPTREHLAVTCLSLQGKEMPFHAANKVINCHMTAG